MIFRAGGPGASSAFSNEAGGHRFQRVPPNEKRGRVQTSTVTVAVLREPEEFEFRINPSDIDVATARGSGPGGQHRNKTESCVIVTHRPSKTVIRVDAERSQQQNRRLAMSLLRARLMEAQKRSTEAAQRNLRRDMVGCGARGDKRRTVAITRDQVVDHVTGIRTTWSKYERGIFEGIW